MIRFKDTQPFALVLGVVLTAVFLIAQMMFTDIPVNPIEALAVMTSFTATWLFVQQRRAAYWWGMVSTILLSYVFYQADLFGSMALNLYLTPTLIYGWYVWGKKRNVDGVVGHNWLWYVLWTGGTYAGAVAIITLAGGQLAFLDGLLLIGSILAQYLLDRKKWENWLVWAVVNVVSVWVYWNAGLYLLAAQFFLFLVNAIYGLVTWRREANA